MVMGCCIVSSEKEEEEKEEQWLVNMMKWFGEEVARCKDKVLGGFSAYLLERDILTEEKDW